RCVPRAVGEVARAAQPVQVAEAVHPVAALRQARRVHRAAAAVEDDPVRAPAVVVAAAPTVRLLDAQTFAVVAGPEAARRASLNLFQARTPVPCETRRLELPAVVAPLALRHTAVGVVSEERVGGGLPAGRRAVAPAVHPEQLVGGVAAIILRARRGRF